MHCLPPPQKAVCQPLAPMPPQAPCMPGVYCAVNTRRPPSPLPHPFFQPLPAGCLPAACFRSRDINGCHWPRTPPSAQPFERRPQFKHEGAASKRKRACSRKSANYPSVGVRAGQRAVLARPCPPRNPQARGALLKSQVICARPKLLTQCAAAAPLHLPTNSQAPQLQAAGTQL